VYAYELELNLRPTRQIVWKVNNSIEGRGWEGVMYFTFSVTGIGRLTPQD